MKRLIVNPSACIACLDCIKACPYHHFHQLAPERSRIRVERIEGESGVPVVCLQCIDAACVKVCPTGALSRNADTGVVEFVESKCVKCRACIVACPFGCMRLDPVGGGPIKCDLCGDDEPLCAVFCPTDALTVQVFDDEQVVGEG